MAHVFKIWNASREKKTAVFVKNAIGSLEQVKAGGSVQLDIDGDELVLEEDGTPINSDDILNFYKEKVLILLKESEKWRGKQPNAEAENTEEHVNLEKEQAQEIPNKLNSRDHNHHQQVVQSKANNLNWKIKWEDFDRAVIEGLEAGSREFKIIRNSVQCVVAQMRKLQTHPPIEWFRVVANEMVDTYPDSFEDRKEDGSRRGHGTATILTKLTTHKDYLNRSKQLSPVMRRQVSQQKVWKQKTAGSLKWNETTYADGETMESQEDKRILLSKFAEFNLDDGETMKIIKNLMELTFCSQRMFLNNEDNSTSLTAIQDKWPCLLSPIYLIEHFELLTGVNVQAEKSKFHRYYSQLVGYGINAKQLRNLDLADDFKMKMLKIVFAHFKEDISNLITMHPDDTIIQDIVITDVYPSIIGIESEPKVYYVVVNRALIDQFSDVEDAAIVMLASYFVFNVIYPKAVACFLEFFQMKFLNIYPQVNCTRTGSSKTTKRVNTFLKKLSTLNTNETIDLAELNSSIELWMSKRTDIIQAEQPIDIVDNST